MSTGSNPQGPRKQGPQKRGSGKKGPQKKSSVPVPGSGGSGGNRNLLIGLAVAGLVILAAVAGYLVFAGSGSSASADAKQLMVADGCDWLAVKSLPSNDHSVLTPTGTSKKWNTNPPTNGPHYATPALWGDYTAPVNQAQIVHNLEHGGIYIQYGPKVPPSTVSEIRNFYDKHQNATVVAPLPRLGDKIAIGAWTTHVASQPNNGTAYLVKCKGFDEKAYSAFFKAYQGKGPERFPMSTLQPGT